MLLTLGVLLISARHSVAQEGSRVTEVPNPMGVHTWFIILVVGSFLAWAISYSLQIQNESLSKKKGREGLLQQKEALLDQIAILETKRELNAISDQQYKQQMKDMRHRLSRVLDKLKEKRV